MSDEPQNGDAFNWEDHETFWGAVFNLGRAIYKAKTQEANTRERWRINYRDYLASKQWQVKANAAKERAGFRCQLCNSDKSLNVHHRTYERLGDEKPGDLIVLCKHCHSKFHDKLPEMNHG